jgi:hypothetical protein
LRSILSTTARRRGRRGSPYRLGGRTDIDDVVDRLLSCRGSIAPWSQDHASPFCHQSSVCASRQARGRSLLEEVPKSSRSTCGQASWWSRCASCCRPI